MYFPDLANHQVILTNLDNFEIPFSVNQIFQMLNSRLPQFENQTDEKFA